VQYIIIGTKLKVVVSRTVSRDVTLVVISNSILISFPERKHRIHTNS